MRGTFPDDQVQKFQKRQRQPKRQAGLFQKIGGPLPEGLVREAERVLQRETRIIGERQVKDQKIKGEEKKIDRDRPPLVPARQSQSVRPHPEGQPAQKKDRQKRGRQE